jgi:hypothetical protein
MSEYLSRSIQVGDKLSLSPMAVGRPFTGVVVAIPSHRRFAVVEFTSQRQLRTYTFRECWLIRPARKIWKGSDRR